MRVAICDDDHLFITELKEKIVTYSIQRNKDIQICEFLSLDSPDLSPSDFDVIFLDIRFEGKKRGIEWAKQLRMGGINTLIVICSSLQNQLIHGYEAEPIRFLLKPVSKSDVFNTLDACYSKLDFQEKRISVKSNFADIFVPVSKILYIESLSRQRNIVLSTGISIHTYETLQKLYSKLDPEKFKFTHKCYVVQLSQVEKIEQNRIHLTNGKQIPLARNFSVDFKKGIMQFMEARI